MSHHCNYSILNGNMILNSFDTKFLIIAKIRLNSRYPFEFIPVIDEMTQHRVCFLAFYFMRHVSILSEDPNEHCCQKTCILPIIRWILENRVCYIQNTDEKKLLCYWHSFQISCTKVFNLVGIDLFSFE